MTPPFGDPASENAGIDPRNPPGESSERSIPNTEDPGLLRTRAALLRELPAPAEELPQACRLLEHEVRRKEAAESTLRDSEARYRLLYDNNPSMYFTLSPQGTVLSVNRFGATQLGYEPHELIDRSVLHVFRPEDHQTVLGQLSVCTSTPLNVFQWEIQKVRKDGSLLWVRERAQAVRDHGGHLLVLVVCEDISERLLEEERVRESEERWRAFYEHAGVGIAQLDLNGRFLRINPRLCETLGYSTKSMTNRTFQELTHPDDLELNLRYLKELVAGTRSSFSMEKRYRRSDETWVWVNLTMSVVRTAVHTPAYLIAIIEDISERKLAQAQLETTSRRLESLIKTIPLGTISLDNEGETVTLWNKAAESIFGWSEEEVMGRPVPFLPPDKRPESDALWDRVAETGQLLGVELSRVRKDGTPVDLQLWGTVLKDERGAVTGSFGLLADITERKRTESLLRESEAAIRSLYEAISTPGLSFEERVQTMLELGCRRFKLPIGALTKAEGEHLRITHAWAPGTPFHAGMSFPLCETFCGTTLIAPGVLSIEHAGASEWITHPAYRTMGLACYIGTALSGPKKLHGTICFLGREPYEGRFSQADKDFLLLMARWVSGELERNEAEQALKEQEGLLRSVIETATDAIFMKDREGRYRFINSAGAAVIGKSPDEVVGRSDLELFPADTAERLRANDQEVFEGNQQRQFEVVLPSQSGPRTFYSIKTPHKDQQGHVVGLVGVARDMTDVKRAQQALQLTQIAVDRSADLAFWIDASGHFIYVNEEASRRLGYSRDELLTMNVADVDPDYQMAVWPAHWQELRRAGRTRFETRHQAKCGEIYPVEVVSNFVLFEGQEYNFAFARDISDRTRAEAALKESESRLRLIINSEPECVKIVSPDGILQSMNPAGLALVEAASEDEVCGRSVFSLIHPHDRAAFVRAHDSVCSGQNAALSFRVIGLRGRERHAETHSVPLRADDGTITGVLSVTRDVTERRRTEEALRTSEERFAKAFRLSPHPLIVTELETGRCLEVNDTGLRLFGYERDEVIGQTVPALRLWPTPEDRARFFERLAAEGSVRNLEATFHAKDRSPRQCLISCEVIVLNGTRCLVTVGNDITDRKRAEAALRDSEERLTRFVEDAPVGLVIMDKDRRMISANKAFCALTGYDKEEILGNSYTLYTHPDDLPGNLKLTDEFYQGLRQDYRIEKRYVRKCGDTIWVSVNATSIDLPSHSGPLLLAVVQDITERKRATESRERLSQDLHDNILQSLYAVGMQLEAGKLVASRSAKQSKQRMTQAIAQLNHLVGDVRQFIALLKQNRTPAMDFRQALQWLVDSSSAASLAVVDLQIDQGAIERVTPEQAEQLLNIAREAISNSVRHAQASRQTVRLKLEPRAVTMRISDDGIGFARSRKRHRGHGLANMAARAKTIGARFALESRRRKGTCITVELPLEEAHERT